MVHFHKKIQNVVVPKERQRFLQILTKKSLGLVIFSRDRRVTPNIHCFVASSINSTPDHSNKNNLEATSFSGPYFPAFGLNTVTYGENIRIQFKYWKIRTTKTPYLDTFQTVDVFKNIKRNLETYISGSLKDILL